jgi:bifunctional non-homologous end joining protein LigD
MEARRNLMSLRTYRSKRDFGRTPEPDGGAGDRRAVRRGQRTTKNGGRFVIHRHRARRLDYDLRLEIGGALASWAVPRGPTLDPAARRLAVEVEDHPLAYFGFEGARSRVSHVGCETSATDSGPWGGSPGRPAVALY